MGKFDGKLLVSDMDSTLLNDDHKVTRENFEAIKYFESEGGTFTVASGRMVDAVRIYLDRILINAPAILHNGAKMYDFTTETVIYEKLIEEKRKVAYRRVYETQPQFGLEVYSKEHIYVLRECFETPRLKATPYNVTYSMPENIWDEKWVKALIIGEETELDKFESIYRTEYDSGTSVRSGKRYLDIVANGVSKGRGVEFLSKKLGISQSNIYTVGDNMNDFEMIRFAGHGFAVANAVEQLKSAAEIVPTNNESAIAYIIENKIN